MLFGVRWMIALTGLLLLGFAQATAGSVPRARVSAVLLSASH